MRSTNNWPNVNVSGGWFFTPWSLGSLLVCSPACDAPNLDLACPPLLLPRQLSKEQHELKGALERQTGVNQKLSQEKEQLVFRLRHRDTCPSMHLPVMLSEVAP